VYPLKTENFLMKITSSQQMTVDGHALEIQRIDGPDPLAPLVFLHEGLGSVAMWRDWPQRLCLHLGHAGLVYSRQGYGQSADRVDVRGAGHLQPNYMHHEALIVLPKLLRQLDIERPILLGHSDGGTIALLHASQHPVEACIVMAPHVVVEDISVRAIAAAKEAFEHGPLRQRLAPYHQHVDTAFWQWNDVWLSDAFRSYDIRAEVARITAPLLAIQGENDPYGTMAQIDDIAAAAPQTQLCKLAACGHSPHRDQSDAVMAAIAKLMAGLKPGL
jgi:pimeloyl-ACP methyl ester carboxylesterase